MLITIVTLYWHTKWWKCLFFLKHKTQEGLFFLENLYARSEYVIHIALLEGPHGWRHFGEKTKTIHFAHDKRESCLWLRHILLTKLRNWDSSRLGDFIFYKFKTLSLIGPIYIMLCPFCFSYFCFASIRMNVSVSRLDCSLIWWPDICCNKNCSEPYFVKWG